MLRFRLTKHFKEKMIQREIKLEHVRMAVESPDILRHRDNSKILVKKRVGDRVIVVVYSEDDVWSTTYIVLITAYYTNKLYEFHSRY